jgi:hypothetical protein
MFKRSVLSVGVILLAIVACDLAFGFQAPVTTSTMSNANCTTTSNGCGFMISTLPSTPTCLSKGVQGRFISSYNNYDSISISSRQVNFSQNSSCRKAGTNPVTCKNCFVVWCG